MRNGYLAPVLSWYAEHARDLPWRQPGASPWAVLVSEIMLQQTPVARVLPAYEAWLARWPTPRSLAQCAPGEAVRQWGRLGYPRRALRLHTAARIITQQHAGQVPASADALAGLPGVGSYTAAAVASFAFAQRHAVLDTNVRRVLARLVGGREFPSRSTSAAETRLAESLLPAEGRDAARWSAPPRARDAPAARSGRTVPGGRRGARRAPGREPRRATRAATGSAEAACSSCSATPAARSGQRTWRRPGPIISSGPGPSTGWWPTAWRNRCRTAGSCCPVSLDSRQADQTSPPAPSVSLTRADGPTSTSLAERTL